MSRCACNYINAIKCVINQCWNRMPNHTFYVEDLGAIAPSFCGLQDLFKICSRFGFENDVIHNPTNRYARLSNHMAFIKISLCLHDFLLC